MVEDRLRPAMLAIRQARGLAAFVAGELHPFAPEARARLDDAGVGRQVREVSDLARVVPVGFDDLVAHGRGEGATLRPTAATLGRSSLRWRWWWARLRGGERRFVQHVVDPLFRPILFLEEADLVVGYTAADLDRLGDLGRRWLESAGVRPGDAVVALAAPRPDLAFWQLSLGCRDAGVPLLHAGLHATPTQVLDLDPTVVAGPPRAVARFLARAQVAEHDLAAVRVVLAIGEPVDPLLRSRMVRAVGSDSVVLEAWAPPGVRALWYECQHRRGLHTWPQDEVIEVLDPLTDLPVADGDDGELVWSAIGWRGTALLRLRTGVFGALHADACTCGRTTYRIEPARLDPPFVAVLDAHPLVGAWQAEVRTTDAGDELLVQLVPTARRGVVPALRQLNDDLWPAELVVVSEIQLKERLERMGGRQIVDRRRRA